MRDIRKCRTMPNGNISVMTFLIVESIEDSDVEKISFISMNGWDNFDCEEIDYCPEEMQETWDLTEIAAVEVMWSNIKERTLRWY